MFTVCCANKNGANLLVTTRHDHHYFDLDPPILTPTPYRHLVPNLMTSSQVDGQKTKETTGRRRLRKLCDIPDHPLKEHEASQASESQKHKEEAAPATISPQRRRLLSALAKPKSSLKFKNKETKLLAVVRAMDPKLEADMKKLMQLAKKSRKNGFHRDERIVTGDIRDTTHTQCSPSTLMFEIARRSSDAATTWEECKAEWTGNIDEGIHGWSCVGGKKSQQHLGYSRTVWLDDASDNSWVEGQCLCLQTRSSDQGPKTTRGIKFRYSAVNKITGEVVTLGSTCINNWGGEFAAKAHDDYGWAVRAIKTPVPGRKWCVV